MTKNKNGSAKLDTKKNGSFKTILAYSELLRNKIPY
jgi:hypothetical protein